jgi:hypothetical protein
MFVIKFTYLYTIKKKSIRKTTFHWVMLYVFKGVGVCNYFLHWASLFMDATLCLKL